MNALESSPADQFVSVSDRGKILATSGVDIRKEAIECQITSRGLLLQCDDLQVLDQFQQHLESLTGPANTTVSDPIVYYLKYTRPDEALRMLAELIDGGEAADPASESLVNATVSSSSLYGSLITNREGTMTLIAGTMTIVADSRLNRLIVQGTSEDIEMIESYLKIIEKDNSITSIETYGRSHIIELANARASDIEAALRKAFAGRVADAAAGARQPGAAGGESRGEDPRAKEKESTKKDNKKTPSKAPAQQARDLEPKMTLAVHEPSNSLIVTAPDALFEEVQKLAMLLDSRAERAIEVITPANSEVFQTVLQELLLGQSGNRRRESRESPKRAPSFRDR